MCHNSLRWLAVLSLPVLCGPPAAPADAQTATAAQIAACDDPSCERRREQLEREKPPRSSFFDRVHLDVLGAPPEIGGGSNLVGLVGAHLTIAEFGRIHLFGPPGVMVAMRPADTERSGRWRPMTALNWGISVRLIEFRLSGTTRRTVMFLNLTKLWTWGDFSRGTDFAGLSFAWKKEDGPRSP
jgi:hypothetical protein